MNARKYLYVLVLVVLLLSACSPAAPTAQPKPVASDPKTSAPAATKAPASAAPAATTAPAAALPQEAPPQGAPSYQKPAPTAGPRQPVATPADNTFEDPGVNPQVNTGKDHLSTFSLDVDTASYSVARSYIMDGNLPPADAVRAEEFINYFNPGYDAPSDSAFTIYADGAPSPYHPKGTYLVRFGVQGYNVPSEERKPFNLVFVIDISGSMNMENRLGLVKRSLQMLVKELDERDRVGIVVFGTGARIALNPTSAAETSTILKTLNGLRTEGSTNAEAGLRMGYKMAESMLRKDSVNRVVLCSDGVANTGLTNPDGILEEVGRSVSKGITLTAVGFGMGNFNDALLERLADRGNGNYAYVDTEDEARRLFVENLISTMQVIAMDAKVQVDFNPDVVASYRLIGYENRAIADNQFRNDSVDAGEIGAGHHATAIYAIQLKSRAEGRIATIQLRWKDPNGSKAREINGNFNTWDIAGSYESTAPHYQLLVSVAQFAEILRQSPYAEETSLNDVLSQARRIKKLLPEDPDVIEWVDLVNRAVKMAN